MNILETNEKNLKSQQKSRQFQQHNRLCKEEQMEILELNTITKIKKCIVWTEQHTGEAEERIRELENRAIEITNLENRRKWTINK